jgi:ABC-type protease/lipase transport system fused ATPase/permease subunit
MGAPPGAERSVIQNVSFRLDAGEALGIVGPSGSGKSTLARFIVGVWTPTGGCARLAGIDVAGWNRSELGPHLGYLSQNIELFEGTIAENIARFGVVSADAVIAAARRAGVHEMILRMSNGYDTRIGLGGNVLSGGQRQRIGLARALYGNPSLVVLDEPNSNLDGQGEAALLSALRELKEGGASVILISHRPSTLEAVDKILVIRDGRVAEFGSRQDVLWKLNPKAADHRGELHEVQSAEQDSTIAALQGAPR